MCCLRSQSIKKDWTQKYLYHEFQDDAGFQLAVDGHLTLLRRCQKLRMFRQVQHYHSAVALLLQ